MRLPASLPKQALRFLLVGGGTTLLQLGLVALLTKPLTANGAFVVSWAVCTLLSTLGHRAFTFERSHHARFDQIVGYATALASLALNSLALWRMHPADGWRGALIVLAVNTVLGIMRFVILRTWFLGRARAEDAD